MSFPNEIEKVKAEIKVLEKKLSFLEELSQTKTPVKEAFKRVYGYYPKGRENGVWTIGDADSWSAFQDGYNEAQKDYKVGEYQEPEEEPVKDKVSLFKRFEKEDVGSYGCLYYGDALKVTREFLLDEAVIENEDHEYITFTLQKSLLEVPND